METLLLSSDSQVFAINGATANVVHYDLDLYIQGREFWKVNISKTVKASENALVWFVCCLIFAIEWIQFECCTPWPCDKFSRLNFSGNYFNKKTLENCRHCYCYHIENPVFAIEYRRCQCCASWHWPTFSRSRIFECEWLENCDSKRKMLNYGFYRG